MTYKWKCACMELYPWRYHLRKRSCKVIEDKVGNVRVRDMNLYSWFVICLKFKYIFQVESPNFELLRIMWELFCYIVTNFTELPGVSYLLWTIGDIKQLDNKV